MSASTFQAFVNVLLRETFILALILAIVGLLLRANPRWRILICELGAGSALLLLGLMVLLPMEIPLKILPINHDSESGASILPHERTGSQRVEWVSDPIRDHFSKASERVDLSSYHKASTDHSRFDSPIRWHAQGPWIVLTVYALGAALFLLGSHHSRCRKRTLESQLAAPPGAIQELLRALAAQVGLSRLPTAKVIDRPLSPFCYVSTRTNAIVIVLPQELTLPSQEGELRTVLLHELYHLAHGDLRRKEWMHWTAVLLWFHPLIWIVRRVHDGALEELCDRQAAEEGPGVSVYQSMLAQFALKYQVPSLREAVGIFGPPQILVRVRRLSVETPIAPLRQMAKRTSFGVALLATVALSYLRLGAQEPAPVEPSPLPFATLSKLETGIDSNYVEIEAAIYSLSASGAKRFLIDGIFVSRIGQWTRFESGQDFLHPTRYEPPIIPAGAKGSFVGGEGNMGSDQATKPAFHAEAWCYIPRLPKNHKNGRAGFQFKLRPILKDDDVVVEAEFEQTALAAFVNRGTPLYLEGTKLPILENEQWHPIFLERRSNMEIGGEHWTHQIGALIAPAEVLEQATAFGEEYTKRDLPELTIECSARRVELPKLAEPAAFPDGEYVALSHHILSVPLDHADEFSRLPPILTNTQFRAFLDQIDSQQGIDLLNMGRVVSKSEGVAKVEAIREMIYPTAYDPPRIQERESAFGDHPSFPVVPMHPTHFQRGTWAWWSARSLPSLSYRRVTLLG